MSFCHDRHAGWPGTLRCISAALFLFLANWCLPGAAQTANIADAWWTYQQDCNGDG